MILMARTISYFKEYVLHGKQIRGNLDMFTDSTLRHFHKFKPFIPQNDIYLDITETKVIAYPDLPRPSNSFQLQIHNRIWVRGYRQVKRDKNPLR